MKQIGAYEAKTHLPRLLKEVERGETFTITNHGRPVARLVPIRPATGSGEDAVAAIKRLRPARNCSDIPLDTVTEAMRQGRR